MRLLRAAGFELRMQLAPYDDHDDVLRQLEAAVGSPGEVDQQVVGACIV